MLTKPMGVALLLVAVAGTALLAWNYLDGMASSSGSPSLRTSAPVPVAGQQAAVPILPFEASLSEQVDRLLATHEPEKAMAAYRLLANCDEFNRLHDRVMMATENVANAHSNRDGLPDYRGMTESEKQHDKVLCAPMTERMRQSRIDYLAIAAAAGVAGASVSFAQEGPFGDRSALTSRPDDLLVREWKEKARAQLTRDAEAADPSALYFLWFQNMNGTVLYEMPAALAFRYGVAMGKIYEDIHGANDASNWFFGEKSPMMQAMVKEMSPEQRAAEGAEAQRIAEVARQRRKRVVDKT